MTIARSAADTAASKAARPVPGGLGGGGAAPSFDYIGANALGAYSIAPLKTGITRVGRVRRSTDNAESDFLTLAEAVAFCGAGSGFLTTWYDQNGSTDVVNTTATQQPRIVNSGVSDSAVVFDGTNDGLSAALSSQTSITIAAWIKPANNGRNIITCINSTRTIFEYNTSQIRWFPNTDTTVVAANTGDISGTWQHVAITQTGTTYVLYLNGVSIGTATTIAISTSSTGLSVGVFAGILFFNGAIYDLRVYSTAKSAGDVLAIKESVTPT